MKRLAVKIQTTFDGKKGKDGSTNLNLLFVTFHNFASLFALTRHGAWTKLWRISEGKK